MSMCDDPLHEDQQEMYLELTRSMKRLIREELKAGNYEHLSYNNRTSHRSGDPQRYKLCPKILVRSPFNDPDGHRSNTSGSLESILTIEATFVDLTNINNGLDFNYAGQIRFDPGTILSKEIFYERIKGNLCLKISLLTQHLNNGDYRSFVKGYLTILNKFMGLYKESKKTTIL